MTRSPVTITEDLSILAGPALLRDPTTFQDLASHRERHGRPARLDVDTLAALAEGARVRGRGGAGFPFARKLRAAAEHARTTRRPVVVVNASEGEPASAKDAVLAMAVPHLVLDGAATAAHALGAREVHVVVPADRPRARALLTAAVAERDDVRLAWHLHVAEPRFVAGQARAVLELLAGRDGLPVTAWQPEAISGHRRRPTLLSNAETWAHIGLLSLEGVGPTLQRGTVEEPGTTLLTVHAPGQPVTVREVEHGTLLTEVLPASAADGPVLIGGFHGTWAAWTTVRSARVSASGLRARGISLGAGVLIATGPDGCAMELTQQIVEHLAAQSAQRCGPCFNGLPALADAVSALKSGAPGARAAAERISGLVVGRGACAHPDGTARLVGSLLQNLGSEVDAHRRGTCAAGLIDQEEAS